jgi:very-long-chain enoyl-CoA reductase
LVGSPSSGYPLCHPDFVSPSAAAVHIGAVLFLIAEAGNLTCHVMLRNLRPSGSERPVPSGFLFDYVSCPNYTFEVLSWVGFSIMTQIPFSYLFTLIGFIQMADWALKKHRGYLQTYGDDYKKLRRKAIVPFLL